MWQLVEMFAKAPNVLLCMNDQVVFFYYNNI